MTLESSEGIPFKGAVRSTPRNTRIIRIARSGAL